MASRCPGSRAARKRRSGSNGHDLTESPIGSTNPKWRSATTGRSLNPIPAFCRAWDIAYWVLESTGFGREGCCCSPLGTVHSTETRMEAVATGLDCQHAQLLPGARLHFRVGGHNPAASEKGKAKGGRLAPLFHPRTDAGIDTGSRGGDAPPW